MKLDRDKFMSEEELKRLLAAVRSRVRKSDGGHSFLSSGKRRGKGDPHPNMWRDYAVLATSALTGIREIELVGFRVGDLRGVVGETQEERPARVRVRRAKKRDPTTGQLGVEEDVIIPDTARKALVTYLSTLPAEERRPWSRVFPITTKQAQRIFKFYAKRAGLNQAYSMHALRHTRGTELYRKHRDLKLVQTALGHANLETTSIYMHTVEVDEKLAATDIDEPKETENEPRSHTRPTGLENNGGEGEKNER
jgi:integrase